MGLTTTLGWATRDAVPGERVFDVLQAWGFELDQHTSFSHWRWVGPPPLTNLLREQMSRVRELDQELGLTLERAAPIRVWLDLGPRRRRPAGLRIGASNGRSGGGSRGARGFWAAKRCPEHHWRRRSETRAAPTAAQLYEEAAPAVSPSWPSSSI